MTTNIENILIAGKYLSTALTGLGCFPEEQCDYDQVRKDFGQPCANIWIAWKELMNLRDSVANGGS